MDRSLKALSLILSYPTRELQAAMPEIGAVLDRLGKQDGVLLIRMSGSGATCFAIFESAEKATEAAKAVAWFERNWWVRATTLGDMSARSAPVSVPAS